MTTDSTEFAQILAKDSLDKDFRPGADIKWLRKLVEEFRIAVYNEACADEREARYWEE